MTDTTRLENSDGVRSRNLARILRLVHRGGPQSRAQLTAETGLNRSTIADLVAELVDTGWVIERDPDPVGRVGRPSPVVEGSPHTVVIAINPEVDAVEIAAVDLARGIAVRERIETDVVLTAVEAVELIAGVVQRWKKEALRGLRVAAIGVAVPGLVRAADGLVRNAPHLGWVDEPLGHLIAQRIELPVAVGNDASVGAVAEHLFGAAVGAHDVVYLNGGPSGIGGGLIVHGQPVGGVGGYAGEFGQNRINTNEGAAIVFEQSVSRKSLLRVLGLAGADDPTLAAALAADESRAVSEECDRQRLVLAGAISNAVNVLNPSVVVLGGFLAMLAEQNSDHFRTLVESGAMAANVEDLQILSASLAADRLLLGAAELAFAAAGVV